jgi:hypothetical protein
LKDVRRYSPETAEVDNFLTEASEGGQINSSGEFTISHFEALRKLREFQLPRVGAFAANLVAAVVLGGGSTIQVTITENVVSFQFDEPIFTQEDLEMLFLSPFQGEAPEWRKEMAIAANGTLGLPLKYLSLDSWDHDQKEGWEMKNYGGDRHEVQKLTRSLKKTSHSRFDLHFGYKRGFKMQHYSLPIHQELKSRCCHAPLHVRLNSRTLSNSPVNGRTDIARRVWRAATPAAGAVLTGEAPQSEECEHDQPFSALMTVVPEGAGEVTLVVNGVSFPAPADTFKLPDWVRLIVAAPHLQKNLSQASLTMSESIGAISTWASAELPTLLEDRCRTFRDLDQDSLRHFNFCLQQTYPDHPSQAVQDWFEHQDLVRQARTASQFDDLSAQARKLSDPLRAKGLWRALRQAQWREFRGAWSERNWETVQSTAKRLQLISQHSVPLSDHEEEMLQTGSCLADQDTTDFRSDTRDILWSAGRSALVLWLGGRHEAAYEQTDRITGFWKHYLRFQLLLPDLEAALPHLDRAIQGSYRATFALNDLAEIHQLRGDFSRGLQTRQNFLKRNPSGKLYWNQVMRIDTRAHGTRSQFAFWNAYTGILEITGAGRAARNLMDRIGRYQSEDWVATLRQTETIKLNNPKWRFLFHRALWALRSEGEWELPKRRLFRRLLLGSYSEKAQTALVPTLSIL